MVTPYTGRLFNRMAEDGVRLGVLSCTSAESNRRWGAPGPQRYTHEILRGIELRVAPRRYAHLNAGIWRALGRMRPKLLVLNGFYPSMLIAWAWARWTGTPMALRVDGGADDMPASLYHRLVRPRILRSSRAVLTSGVKGTRYFTAQGFAPEQVFEMPLVPAWDAPAALPGFAERDTDLLWVAEIDDAVKNASFFIEVVRRVHALRPGLRVRIVGEDRGIALAARLKQLGIAVRHDSVIPWHDMAQTFARAKLLLLPSRREAWGLVCNEAMQCGTPCLVSEHVGAADDLVREGRNGRVLPLDHGRWVASVQALLGDPAIWAAYSSHARTDASRRTVTGSAAIYRRMAAFATSGATASANMVPAE
jgi:glycosyltransferase involved in cell wall biosynthesis